MISTACSATPPWSSLQPASEHRNSVAVVQAQKKCHTKQAESGVGQFTAASQAHKQRCGGAGTEEMPHKAESGVGHSFEGMVRRSNEVEPCGPGGVAPCLVDQRALHRALWTRGCCTVACRGHGGPKHVPEQWAMNALWKALAVAADF